MTDAAFNRLIKALESIEKAIKESTENNKPRGCKENETIHR